MGYSERFFNVINRLNDSMEAHIESRKQKEELDRLFSGLTTIFTQEDRFLTCIEDNLLLFEKYQSLPLESQKSLKLLEGGLYPGLKEKNPNMLNFHIPTSNDVFENEILERHFLISKPSMWVCPHSVDPALEFHIKKRFKMESKRLFEMRNQHREQILKYSQHHDWLRNLFIKAGAGHLCSWILR